MFNKTFASLVTSLMLTAPAVWAQSAQPTAAAMAEPAATQIGELTITAPFSRATLPNAPVAGGFMQITNSGTTDDRLISATSEIAGRTEIHEMTMANDIMKMNALPDGLPIPTGQTVMLEPGGFHLMFMDLQNPLIEAGTFDVSLTFERAGTVTVSVPIGAMNAASGMAPMMHGGN